MADILIKGMEMPSDEKHSVVLVFGKDGFEEARDSYSALKIEGITAIALPEHGRLVSAEDFIDSFEDIINECRRQLSEKGEDITVLNYFHDTIVELMGYMPTVLEATE